MIEPYSFDDAIKQWGRPPVEGRGYIPSTEALQKTDDELRLWATDASKKRFESWRGNYADALRLDDDHGRVLDYGCGFGTDTLRMAQAGSKIILTDINEQNVLAAHKIHSAFGLHPGGTAKINGSSPFIDPCPDFDTFFSAGVLHHFPYPDDVMGWVPGHCRRAILLVYSDRLWRDRTSTEMIGVDDNVLDHPKHSVFCRSVDGVGNYAEPYDEARISKKLAAPGSWNICDLIKVGANDEFYAIHMDRS